MLTSLRLFNFKNHEDTLIEGLQPLSVFVGPNAVGKSSILEAVQLVSDFGDPRKEKELQASIPEVARLGSDEFSIDAKGETSGESWQVDVNFYCVNDHWTSVYELVPESLLPSPKSISQVVGQAIYLRLDPTRIKEPSPVDALPRLFPNGYGLASVIGHLMQSEPDLHRQLTENLRHIVPTVKGIRTRRIYSHIPPTGAHGTADQLLFDTADGRGVPASRQSDGTLHALALLTAFSLDESPRRIVLLDDVETGLHPEAQRKLVDLLREIVGDGSRVQLLMTTHSPYIVDGMKPEEVWVCGRDKNKRVRVKRLSDLPNVQQALGVLTTGELWGELGEDWVADEG